ncbi:hypothetical protein C1N90_18145 [Priestia aryabhattai]
MVATHTRSKEPTKKEHSFSILYKNKRSFFNKNSKVFQIISMNNVEFIILLKKKHLIYLEKDIEITKKHEKMFYKAKFRNEIINKICHNK